MNEEKWRPVPIEKYCDYFHVSDRGRIARIISGKGDKVFKILKGHARPVTRQKELGKIVYVCLTVDGISKDFIVARLVAGAFVGDVGGKIVLHKNLRGDDNRAENLKIVADMTACLNEACEIRGMSLREMTVKRMTSKRLNEWRKNIAVDTVVFFKYGYMLLEGTFSEKVTTDKNVYRIRSNKFFPTGLKWIDVPEQDVFPNNIMCAARINNDISIEMKAKNNEIRLLREKKITVPPEIGKNSL